jgi:N-acetylneuraminic acid mutarotase
VNRLYDRFCDAPDAEPFLKSDARRGIYNPLYLSPGVFPMLSVNRWSVFLLGLTVLSTTAAAQNSPVNQWTWMGGSNTAGCVIFVGVNFCGIQGQYGVQGAGMASNIPGSRTDALTWTDQNGHFWLFGGNGFDSQFNFGYLNDLWEFDPTSNVWTWQGGSETLPLSIVNVPNCNMQLGDDPCAASGVYGTKGSAAAGNIPGSHAYGSGWTDGKGGFWLFGGYGIDANGHYGTMSDLWEYNPSTGQWGWMAGSDLSAEPGVYGAMGTPAATNSPGSRVGTITWVDSSHNLWLFGGAGQDAAGNDCYLNDLWEFDTSVNEWVWIGGVSTVTNIHNECGQPGLYGTEGSPDTENYPGGREFGSSWTDSSGNFWLFGGWGFDSTPGGQSAVRLNDVWKFNPTTKQWTWMNGSNVGNVAGNAGVLGQPGAGNSPASRQNGSSWVDGSGNFWLFGGTVDFDDSCECTYNDLWEISPSANQWEWMGGSIDPGFPGTEEVPGVYGTLGASDATNIPGSRTDAMSWTDSSGSLWLFGGNGFDANNHLVWLNDMWMYRLVAGSTKTIPAVTANSATTNPTTAQPLSIAVTVTAGNGDPIPTGTIILNYGNYNTPPTTLSAGAANVKLAAGILPAGTDTILANYTPDPNSSSTYLGAFGSIPLTVTQAPDFSLVSGAASMTPGQSAANSTRVTVEPLGGFTGSVALTAAVTSSPTGAVNLPTLSFGTTSPVNIASDAAETATLTINTTAAQSSPCSAANRKPESASSDEGAGLAVAFVLLLGIPARRRNWRKMFGLWILTALFAGGILGCGGGGSGGGTCIATVQPGTTAGAYQVTVTGTSGSLKETSTFTLTVE